MTDYILSRGGALFHNDIMCRGIMNVACGVNTVYEAIRRGFQRTRDYWRGTDNGNRWRWLKDALREMLNIGRGVFLAYRGVRELQETCMV